MKKIKREVFETSDGKIFLEENDAFNHEQRLGRLGQIHSIMNTYAAQKSDNFVWTYDAMAQFILDEGSTIAKEVFDFYS